MKGSSAVVQAIEENPDIKIGDLIKNNDDLITPYRLKNPTFIGYLLCHNNMVDFVQFLLSNDATKPDHKKLVSLMQSNNTTLHRTFADTTQLATEMLKSFSKDENADGSKELYPNGQQLYAIGTFTRILTRAFDQWPQEMWQIFFSTENVLVDIINNLHLSCVVQEISDKFNDQHYPHVSILMWNIFQAFVGEDYGSKYETPIFSKYSIPIEGSPNVYQLHKNLTQVHKKNIIFLLGEFIKSAPLNNELFYDAIYRYIYHYFLHGTDEDKVDITNLDAAVQSNNEDDRFAFKLFEIAGLIDPTIYDYWKNIDPSPYKYDELVSHQKNTSKLAKKLLDILLEKINDDNYQILEVKIHSVLAYLSSWTNSEIMNSDLAYDIVTKCLKPNASQIRLLNLLKMVQYIIEDNKNWFGDFKSKIQTHLDELAKQLSGKDIDYTKASGANDSYPVLLDNIMTMNRLLKDSDFIQAQSSNSEQNDDSQKADPKSVSDLIPSQDDIIEKEKSLWAIQQFIDFNEDNTKDPNMKIEKLIIPVVHNKIPQTE